MKKCCMNEVFLNNNHAWRKIMGRDTTDDDAVERKPDDASEDQLDEALEETFPASDPISP